MNCFRVGFCVWCFYSGQFICVRVSYSVFCVFPLCCCLVVNTSAIDSLERLISEMTCYVSSRMLNPAHILSFIHLCVCGVRVCVVVSFPKWLLVSTVREHFTMCLCVFISLWRFIREYRQCVLDSRWFVSSDSMLLDNQRSMISTSSVR